MMAGEGRMDVLEPTLGDVLCDLWQARFYLCGGALLGVVLAVLFFWTAVPHYRATMLVGPAAQAEGVQTLRHDAEDTALPVLAPVATLGAYDSPDFMRFEHTLRGPAVAAVLFEDERIRKGMDKSRKFRFAVGAKEDLTPARLAEYLDKAIEIEPIGATPLRRIVYRHPDPAFAAYLLQRLHTVTDDLIRADMRARTEDRVSYLHQAMASAGHPDHRRALTALLMKQEHIRMMLALDQPFAAIVAEDPAAGPRPAWPSWILIFPVFALIGAFTGFAIFGIRRSLRHA